MSDFLPGDRVRYIAKDFISRVHIGMVGIVVHVVGVTAFVWWDDDIGGHDCNGRCPDGHGWNVPFSTLSLVDTGGPFSPAPLPDFEALFSCAAV